MMRIAVAGGCGLGYLIATGLSQAETAYNVVVLSRTLRREFAPFGIQVHVVDYTDKASLQFALQGIDLIISTISGNEQLNLINAAGHGRIRYFVPSEFEGSLSHRPSPHCDTQDRGSSQALALLQQWSDASRMKYTVFSCGIFMEHFHPFGLGSFSIGHGAGVANVGDYLLDMTLGIAEYPEKTAKGTTVRICLTSIYDVVRFIIAAVDIGPKHWPKEYTLRGDKLSLRDVVDACGQARGAQFEHSTVKYGELASYITYFTQTGQLDRVSYYQRLLETANGRYEFSRATLNEAVDKSSRADVRPVNFKTWLASALTG